MVRMLDRMLMRQLRHDGLLIGAIAGIMVIGVLCFVTMQSAYQNLRRSQRDYYAQCRMGDFWIRVKKAPLRQLESLAKQPGVQAIDARIQSYATVDLDEVEKPLNCTVLSLPDRRRSVTNDIVLRSGSYFTPGRDNEVIVIDQFARARGIRPGQWIHLMLNNRRQPLLVVGTAISSEFTYLLGPGTIVPDPEQYGVFYIKHSFAEGAFDFDDATNEFVGRWAAADSSQRELWMRNLESQLEPYGVITTTHRARQPSHQFLDGEIAGLGVTASVLPSMFLVVAALVLNVLVVRVAKRQRTVVGTLKAIGYTDGQIFMYFVKFGVIVGLAAGIVGSLLGYLAATGMTITYRQYFEFPALDSGFHLYAYLIGIGISLACATAGSLRGAHSMYRLRPAESMRPEPPRRGGAVWMERFTTVWRNLSTPWKLALRSVLRQRFRTATGVFSTAMGATMLTSGFMMVETTHFLIDFQFRDTSQSDVELAFESERGRDALDESAQMVGVDYAEPVFALPCTFVHGSFRYKSAITGLQENARLTVPRQHERTEGADSRSRSRAHRTTGRHPECKCRSNDHGHPHARRATASSTSGGADR